MECQRCSKAKAKRQVCPGCRHMHGHGAVHWKDNRIGLVYLCDKCAEINEELWQTNAVSSI